MKSYTDIQIIEKINEYMDSSEHPDLVGYRTQTRSRDFADPDRFLWGLRYIAALGQYRNKRILEVGCGFGWHAAALWMLHPSNQILGLDILPGMIEGMSECIAALQRRGTPLKVSALCADICDVDLHDESFDAIYSNEAIEHVHDMKRMLDSCARLLRKGGNMILVNDANVLNPKVRETLMSMWRRRERDPKWSEYLREIRPVEHGDAKPFAVVREEIIKAANPKLLPEAVDDLVERTAGLLKGEIEAAAKGATPRNVPILDRCRNPITGEYAERLFDPFALAELTKQAGFRVKVRHMFHRSPFHLLNGVRFLPLNRYLFTLSRLLKNSARLG